MVKMQPLPVSGIISSDLIVLPASAFIREPVVDIMLKCLAVVELNAIVLVLMTVLVLNRGRCVI